MTGREWRCSCGAWIPWAYGRHPHNKPRDQSLADMVAARERGEPDPLYSQVEVSFEWRTAEHAVREVSFG